MEPERVPRDLLMEVELRRGSMRRTLRLALRAAIQDGRLLAGTSLPSSRTLAGDLGVSRGVVSDVYDELGVEGYLEVRPRRAPLVAQVGSPVPSMTVPEPPALPFDFIATTPDVQLFPGRAWLRATARALASADLRALDYGDHRGQYALRSQLAGYLARVRGVRTTPDRIIVTQGFTQALDLMCRVLVTSRARTVAIESPSLPDTWDTIQRSGLAVAAVPVDDQGIDAAAIPAEADAVIVTPAHQFPTGVVMTVARRDAILRWAAGGGHLVIEDDYDAEFRYDRVGVGSLQGREPEHVVHVGTASKALAPGIRLGWMSVPERLVPALVAAKRATDSGSPTLDQLALGLLIGSGDYDRHIGRVRRVYRARRDELVARLDAAFPDRAIEGAAAGLHVLMRLPNNADDVAIAATAAEHGVSVRPLSPLVLGGAPRRGLLLGYGRLEIGRIDQAVDRLAAAM